MTLEENFKYYSLHHSVEMTDSFKWLLIIWALLIFLEPSQLDLFSRYRHFVEEWPDQTNKNKINKQMNKSFGQLNSSQFWANFFLPWRFVDFIYMPNYVWISWWLHKDLALLKTITLQTNTETKYNLVDA